MMIVALAVILVQVGILTAVALNVKVVDRSGEEFVETADVPHFFRRPSSSGRPGR